MVGLTGPAPEKEAVVPTISYSNVDFFGEKMRELFEQWILSDSKSKPSALSQDEGLIIGIGENLELLEEFFGGGMRCRRSCIVLLSAICVVLYNNEPDSGPG
ncbi:MAG: hypothetical protein AAF514_23780 [Verrucomicrobiota bacterium]